MTAAIVKAVTHILVQQKCGTWHWQRVTQRNLRQ